MKFNKLVLGILLSVWHPCTHTINEIVAQSIQLDILARAVIVGNFLDPNNVQTAFITRFTPSGVQDPTYAPLNGGFFVVEQVGPQDARGLALVKDQPVLAGVAFDDSVSNYFLAQSTLTGLPDNFFGTSGVVRSIDGDWSRANAIAFLAGSESLLITCGDIVSDGQPMGGIAVYDAASGAVEQQIQVNLGRNTSLQNLDVLIETEKRTVFAGFNQGFTSCQGILTQYVGSGFIGELIPDLSFGVSGVVLTPLAERKKYFDVCGKEKEDIFVLGTQDGSPIIDRYLSNGVINSVWGSSGTFFVPQGLSAQLKAIKCLDDNSLIAVGAQTTFGFPQLLALKISPSGTELDQTFGQSGVYCLPTDDVSFANDVDMDLEGNLYLAGAFGNNLLVLKLSPSGIIDNSYGQNGLISTLEEVANPITILQDLKPSGDGGGKFGATSVIRTFNTLVGGTNRVALGAGGTQFALAPGSYFVQAIVPAAGVGGHIVQLYDVTNDRVVAQGTSQTGIPLVAGSPGVNTYSILYSSINIHEETVFEIRHLTTSPSLSPDSLGAPADISGVFELYTQVSIMELNPLAIPV